MTINYITSYVGKNTHHTECKEEEFSTIEAQRQLQDSHYYSIKIDYHIPRKVVEDAFDKLGIPERSFAMYADLIAGMAVDHIQYGLETRMPQFVESDIIHEPFPENSIVRLAAKTIDYSQIRIMNNEFNIPIETVKNLNGIVTGCDQDSKKARVLFVNESSGKTIALNCPTADLISVHPNNRFPIDTKVFVELYQEGWVEGRIVENRIAPFYHVEIHNTSKYYRKEWIQSRDIIPFPYEALGELKENIRLTSQLDHVIYYHLIISDTSKEDAVLFSVINANTRELIEAALSELMGPNGYWDFYSNHKEITETKLADVLREQCRNRDLSIDWKLINRKELFEIYSNQLIIKAPSYLMEAVTSERL